MSGGTPSQRGGTTFLFREVCAGREGGGGGRRRRRGWVRPWPWEGNFLFNSPTGDERARREKVHGNVLDSRELPTAAFYGHLIRFDNCLRGRCRLSPMRGT